MLEPADRTDRVGDGSLVERPRAVAGDRAQRHRQLGQPPAQATRRRRGKLRRNPCCGPGGARSGRGRPGGGRPSGDGESALGGIDRVGETGLEPEPPVPGRERDPPGHGSRDGDRARTSLLDRSNRIGAPWRGAGGIEPLDSLAGPDDGERVAADASRHRFGHAQHGRSGERRIGRVPAPLEHPQPRSSRERLAGGNHALRSDGRRSPVREAERHQLRRLRSARRRPARPMCPVRPGCVATRSRPRGGCRTRRWDSS